MPYRLTTLSSCCSWHVGSKSQLRQHFTTKQAAFRLSPLREQSFSETQVVSTIHFVRQTTHAEFLVCKMNIRVLLLWITRRWYIHVYVVN